MDGFMGAMYFLGSGGKGGRVRLRGGGECFWWGYFCVSGG